MYILAVFTVEGNGHSGLSATVDIFDVSGNKKILTADMQDVGDGLYRYDFTGYDHKKDYAYICKSNSELTDSFINVAVSNNYQYLIDLLVQEFESGNLKITGLIEDTQLDYRVKNKTAGVNDLVYYYYKTQNLTPKQIANRLKLKQNTVIEKLKGMELM